MKNVRAGYGILAKKERECGIRNPAPPPDPANCIIVSKYVHQPYGHFTECLKFEGCM